MSSNIAFDPLPVSLTSLPVKYKKDVESYLLNWLENYDGNNKTLITRFINGAINFMFSKDTYDPASYISHYEERLGVQFDRAKQYLELPHRIYEESLVLMQTERK